MAKGRKTGGRNFKKGEGGRKKGAKDKVPRSLKGQLRAVLEEISQVEEPLIYQRIVQGIRGRAPLPWVQFLANYLIDKNVRVSFDYSQLSTEQIEQLRQLVALTQPAGSRS